MFLVAFDSARHLKDKFWKCTLNHSIINGIL